MPGRTTSKTRPDRLLRLLPSSTSVQVPSMLEYARAPPTSGTIWPLRPYPGALQVHAGIGTRHSIGQGRNPSPRSGTVGRLDRSLLTRPRRLRAVTLTSASHAV